MRTIIAVFRLATPSNILGLLWFFVALSFYKIFGIKLLNGISLTFRDISLYLRPDFPSGIRFIKELISDNVYRNFHTLPHTGETILLDVGANIGLVSLDRCLHNPRLRAYCFEPHPGTFSLLRINVEINQLSDRISVYNYAVSDHTGTIAIIANSQGNMAKTVEPHEPSTPDTIPVSCWTLDAFCSLHHIKPTYLKVDVEGHESAVLTGAKSVLNDISEVIVECHSEQLTLACKQLLTDHGFTISYASGLMLGRKAA
jgi:FkbM family methyltransferase